MRRLLAAALVFGFVQGAQAADMPDLPFLRGSQDIGVPLRPLWQGYYVGGQASYGAFSANVRPTLNADLQSRFIPPAGQSYNWQPLPGTASEQRVGFGGFFGYNSQWDDVVVGVEANYMHTDFKPTVSSIGYTYTPSLAVVTSAFSSATPQVTDFGSGRIRAGYVIGSFLPYAFGGAGIGSAQLDRSVAVTPDPRLPAVNSSTTGKLVYGYSAGIGVDMMVFSSLLLRAEYEYLRVTTTVPATINSARVGLGYKF